MTRAIAGGGCVLVAVSVVGASQPPPRATECLPHSQPQRTQTSLAIDPDNDNVVYVGLEQDGFFKSIDGGTTWVKSVDGIRSEPKTNGDGLCHGEFYSGVVAAQNPNRICVAQNGSPGTISLPASPAAYNGVYCSSDGGLNWTQLATPTMNTAVYAVAIDPANTDVMYAGVNGNRASYPGAPDTLFNTIGTIYKTIDAGRTWTELNTGFVEGQRVNDIYIDPTNPQVIYAGSFAQRSGGGSSNYLPVQQQYAILKSVDGGATWVARTNGMNLTQPGFLATRRINLSPRDPRRLFMVTFQSAQYYSPDAAATFATPPGAQGYTSVFNFDPHDPEGDRLLGITGPNVVRSDDGGARWSVHGALPAEANNNPVFPSDLEWSRQNPNTVYISGSHGRVYKSTDGGVSWATMLRGDALPRPPVTPTAGVLDFNRDGRGDVFGYNAATGAWTIGLFNQTGSFGRITGAWSARWVVRSADFNNDRFTDFFVYNPSTGDWAKAIATHRGTFQYFSSRWSPGWTPHVLDLNGDGRSDVFLYDAVSGLWFRCVSSGDGSADFAYQSGVWSPGWQLTAAELNGDTFADLFLYNSSSGDWFWAVNDGVAAFSYTPGRWSAGWSIRAANFDTDARNDVFLYNAATGDWFICTNTGAGFSYVGSAWSAGWSVSLGDFDADGRSDVFLYSVSSGVWFECLNNGAGGFTYHTGTWSPAGAVSIADLDADRKSDVVLYEPATGRGFQALATTAGAFTIRPFTWDAGLSLISSR